MGTPDFAVPTLRALKEQGHEVVAAYSQPPRPRGRRGLDLIVSPVHKAAQELGVPVFTPASFDEAEQQRFSSLKLDAVVVVAYGLLLPSTVLTATRFGCYNGHASLLPRWRGAAPIQRAIMAGDSETGIMVMKMEAGLDTGPVALTSRVPIDVSMTGGQLHDALSIIGADLMVAALRNLEAGTLTLQAQTREGVTYAHKITKQETRIDWKKPAVEIERMIRALAPTPAAWCEMEIAGKRERVKVLSAQFENADSQVLPIPCAGGEPLFLTKLQKAGGKVLGVEEFLRGHIINAVL